MKKQVVAMLLAGGEGKRLGVLTQKLAKPAVHYGGKYRIIDFALSNCCNSGIDTVGVLTQYQPLVLNSYIGIGSSWDLDRKNGGVTLLPPFVQQGGGEWYKGTANAIYQNINFIDGHDPDYVLVISGDHIYQMDYSQMIATHKRNGADATIAVIEVPWEEASRFGIMNVDDRGRILDFAEKPAEPKTNLASMGIYIFTWEVLKAYLVADEGNPDSSNDFGKDIIPAMLREERILQSYRFRGYWKDVGTIDSLWESNMDLLADLPELNLHAQDSRIYSVNPNQPPQYVADSARINRSLINEGCLVFGEVDHSVLFYGVHVGRNAVVRDSIIMPNVRIGENVTIHKAIIGGNSVIEDGAVIGDIEAGPSAEIVVYGEGSCLTADVSTQVATASEEK